MGRAWALERIIQFTVAGNGAVLAVVAKPGTGKTALAVRLARIASSDAPPLPNAPVPEFHAVHFCQWSQTASIDAVSVLEHLANQLTATVPEYTEHLVSSASGGETQIRVDIRVHQAEPGASVTGIGTVSISDRDPRSAFEVLIRRPLASLYELGKRRRAAILIDGLDESVEGSTAPAGKTLVDLLAVELASPIPGVQWVLTTRGENVLPRLIGCVDEELHLDGDAPPGMDEILAYAESRLRAIPDRSRRVLAHRISDAAKGNFLYAYHIIRDLVEMSSPPADLAGIPLPADLAGFYRGFLDRKIALGDDWSRCYRPVLGALTQARGNGLTIDQLAIVTGMPQSQLNDALRSCAPYLSGDPSTGITIYHQSLRDYLRADGPHHIYPSEASAKILRQLAPGPPGVRRWDQADRHILAYGIYYALDAGMAAELVTDPGFLIHAEPKLLLPALHLVERGSSVNQLVAERGTDLATAPGTPKWNSGLAVTVYRTSAHAYPEMSMRERRQTLALDAARWGIPDVATSVEKSPVAGQPPPLARIAWATGSTLGSAQIAKFTGHEKGVYAVAVGQLHGLPIAVTGSFDGTVIVWDLAKRLLLFQIATQCGAVRAVAVGELNGRPVAVTGCGDRSVRVWDLDERAPLGSVLTGHRGEICALALGDIGGCPVAVTGSFDRTVQVCNLNTGSRLGWFTGFDATVTAVTLSELDGTPVAVVCSGRSAEILDLAAYTPLGRPLTGHSEAVRGAALIELAGSRRAVTASLDGTMRLWDLATRTSLGAPLTGRIGPIATVAVANLNWGPVAVAGSFDGTVETWDLASRSPRDHFRGHEAVVAAIAIGEMEGRSVAVTGSTDRTVGVWDLTQRVPLGRPLNGHNATVRAVAAGELSGRPVAITGGDDRTVRVWDLAQGAPLGDPLNGHNATVRAVAAGELSGRPVAITGGDDGTLRMWDLARRGPLCYPLTTQHGAVTAACTSDLNGRLIAVTSVDDGSVWTWDMSQQPPHGSALTGYGAFVVQASNRTLHKTWLTSRGLLGDVMIGEEDWMTTIATGKLDHRLVALTGGVDGAVRVWDLTRRAQLDEHRAFAGHNRPVTAVALGKVGESPVAVSGGADGTLQIWDIDDGIPFPLFRDLPEHADSVTAVAICDVGGLAVAISGSDDFTMRIWDLASGKTHETMLLPSPPRAFAVGKGPIILVAFGSDIAAYRLVADEQGTRVKQQEEHYCDFQRKIASEMTARGYHQEAETKYRKVLAVYLQTVGADHPDALATRNAIAGELTAQDLHQDAEAEYRLLAADCERVLGTHHADTIAAETQVAVELVSQGEHQEAEAQYRFLLAKTERVHGADRQEALQIRSCIARQLAAQGKHQEAEAEFRDVLAMREFLLGTEQPDTLAAEFMVATQLSAQGEHQDAETAYRRVLAAREQVLGPDHTDTLAARFKVAVELAAQGRHKEAETGFRVVLTARQRILGVDDVETVIAQIRIAEELAAQERHHESEAAYRSALTVLESVQGRYHPDTLETRYRIACELAAQQRHPDAEAEYRALLAVRERDLGREHPGTLAARIGIAEELAAQNRHQEAETEYREVLAAQQHMLGSDHMRTLITRVRVGAELAAQGKDQEATAEYRTVLTAWEQTLGPDHPDTLAIKQLIDDNSAW